MNLPESFPRDVQAIACDLDRTLIWEDLAIRPRTLAAIAAARETGIPVIIVTGRMFRSVRPYARLAGIAEPVVCYQGAVVADPASGRFLRHKPIPLELAREAIEAVEGDGYALNCYVDDELYVAAHTTASDRYAGFQNIPVEAVGPLLEWLDRPPTKLVTIGDPAELDELEVRMKARFEGRLFISKSLPYFLEIADREVSKGSGIAFVAEHLGFDLARTVGVGDGENDFELLEATGFGVAVANAHHRLLSIADWVCPPADDEGVAQVIEAALELRS